MLALLKRAHGIELKSASSTIEEVVARQFVERLARERNVTLPGGDMFAEGPAAKPGAKKPAPGGKKGGAREAGCADTRPSSSCQNRQTGCACRSAGCGRTGHRRAGARGTACAATSRGTGRNTRTRRPN